MINPNDSKISAKTKSSRITKIVDFTLILDFWAINKLSVSFSECTIMMSDSFNPELTKVSIFSISPEKYFIFFVSDNPQFK